MPVLEWMMWTTLLKTMQGMVCAYHRKWMGPMVGPLEDDLGQQLLRRRIIVKRHNGGASWGQNANVGNDSSNWGETQH